MELQARKVTEGGTVLTFQEGFNIYHALVFTFSPANNEVEYEALIGGIHLAKKVGVERIRI